MKGGDGSLRPFFHPLVEGVKQVRSWRAIQNPTSGVAGKRVLKGGNKSVRPVREEKPGLGMLSGQSEQDLARIDAYTG
jgi:hypothetical protein